MSSCECDDGNASGFQPTDPFGVWGDSGSTGPFGRGGNGVIGSSALYSGVAGVTLANNDRAAGVFGIGPSVGMAGFITGASTAPGDKVGVYGTGSNGKNLGGVGVIGIGDTKEGVIGESNSAPGVLGLTSTGAGVLGVSSENVGVLGLSNGVGVLGVGGSNGGLFFGNVEVFGDVAVTGSLSKSGGGFRIDHPLDPENKYLRHSFVESQEMKNLYDGIVVCDERGQAVIELPAWFEALNDQFRYQLTPIGAPAPNLFVAEEIKGNRFTIGGGVHGLKVSWQVTGVRQDAWAKANPVVADEEKPAAEQGSYSHPELHGQPRERGIGYERQTRAEEYHPRRR